MKTKIFLFGALLLISGIVSAQEKPEPAGKIMDEACKIAAKEGKSVLIVFHASWCGWCKKFEASVNDPVCKDFFNRNFVIKYLDILERGDKKSLENPEAIDIYNKFGGQDGGIPFFLIFDKNKSLLSDSKMSVAGDGGKTSMQNIGCPTSEEEITAFIKILEKATKVSDKDKAAILERFKKNKS
jgi:thiol-disulfide isomerase/thioredoxin